VAGVVVHGDNDSVELEDQFDELVERYIPEDDRPGFIFHATDLFHGGPYFDRQRWPREVRLQILNDLAKVIKDLSLPVVAGFYKKEGFGAGVLSPTESEIFKHGIMHTMAAIDCAMWADRWLEKFSPNENAVVIAEDVDRVKRLIKAAIRVLRSEDLILKNGLGAVIGPVGLPLKRIVDTVHFAEKADARALQLADLCAFTLGRAAKDKSVPLPVFEIIWNHLKWTIPISRARGVSLPSELPDFSGGQSS
jgi:hypothetical protein